MTSNRIATASCALGMLTYAALMSVVSVPDAAATSVNAEGTQVIDLTWDGLVGLPCAGGTIGDVDGFDVGEYIIVNESLVLRARAEVENNPPLGSPEGNVADLYVASGADGLGAGSIADAGRPGSSKISGGGPHGSEIVHLIFNGDPMVSDPKTVAPDTIVIRVSEFRMSKTDLSVILHTMDGQIYVFPPSVVKPMMVAVSDRTYDLSFSDLPGIDDIEQLGRFDVRSGWYDEDRGKLSGGHFWLVSVSFISEPPMPLAFEQFD